MIYKLKYPTIWNWLTVALLGLMPNYLQLDSLGNCESTYHMFDVNDEYSLENTRLNYQSNNHIPVQANL